MEGVDPWNFFFVDSAPKQLIGLSFELSPVRRRRRRRRRTACRLVDVFTFERFLRPIVVTSAAWSSSGDTALFIQRLSKLACVLVCDVTTTVFCDMTSCMLTQSHVTHIKRNIAPRPFPSKSFVGRGSSVVIATPGLSADRIPVGGEIFRTPSRRDLGPTQPLFSVGKAAEAWR